MPIPALLMQLLPMLASAAASGVGSYMGQKGQQYPGPQPPQGQIGNSSDITSQKGPGGETFTTFNRFSPEQQQMQQQFLTSLGPLLQGLLNRGPGGGARAEEARAQFNEQIVPSIAERFTSMGEGAQSTEAFKRSLGSAGMGLERGIAADQEGSEQNLLQLLLSGGMAPQRESFVSPRQPGFFESISGGLGQGIGYAAPHVASNFLEQYFKKNEIPKP